MPQYVPSPFESSMPRWLMFRSAVYLNGHGAHFGAVHGQIVPKRALAPGISCVAIGGPDSAYVSVKDAIASLAPGSLDWVVLEQTGEVTEHIVKLLHNGSHLIQFAKDTALPALPPRGSWTIKDEQHRDGWALRIARYARDGKRGVFRRPKPTKPRVCIARYGAIGDMVVITPAIRRFAAMGYDITVNATQGSHVVLHENPHVTNLLPQPRDMVFNPWLGEYWREWSREYDVYCNLSESVEASVLRTQGRADFYWPAERRREAAENYYSRTMRLCGIEPQPATVDACRPELFFTAAEQRQAADIAKQLRRTAPKLVGWALRGTSPHKVYPAAGVAAGALLRRHSDVGIVQLGGPDAGDYVFGEDATPDYAPRLHSLVGKLPLRLSLALLEHLDCIVGPETGLLNAAACYDHVAKVLLLSHSDGHSIAGYWPNTTALAPDAVCHPCFQLHHTDDSCPRVELEAGDQKIVLPRCTVGIQIADVVEAIESKLL